METANWTFLWTVLSDDQSIPISKQSIPISMSGNDALHPHFLHNCFCDSIHFRSCDSTHFPFRFLPDKCSFSFIFSSFSFHPTLFSLGHIVSLKIHYSLSLTSPGFPLHGCFHDLWPAPLGSCILRPQASPSCSLSYITGVLLDILTCMPFLMSALPGMSLLPFLLKSFPQCLVNCLLQDVLRPHHSIWKDFLPAIAEKSHFT